MGCDASDISNILLCPKLRGRFTRRELRSVLRENADQPVTSRLDSSLAALSAIDIRSCARDP
jgi:hypothetical protein